MKTPHLLASFAVAATASAAEFKDPSEVARAWDENTTPTKPLTDDLSLRGTPPPLQTFPKPRPPLLRDKPKDLFQVPPWSTPNPTPSEPGPRIDSPRNRAPEELPNNVPMPRGAKPWLYGGQTYWLMPLIPSQEK